MRSLQAQDLKITDVGTIIRVEPDNDGEITGRLIGFKLEADASDHLTVSGHVYRAVGEATLTFPFGRITVPLTTNIAVPEVLNSTDQ